MPKKKKSPQITIYTDGSSHAKKNLPIGYAAVLIYKSKKHKEKVLKVLFDSDEKGSNNTAEMKAVILGLGYFKKKRRIMLVVDAKNLKLACEQWRYKWVARGWRDARGRKVQHRALWEQLFALVDKHEVQWRWTKGHAKRGSEDAYYNGLVDQWAVWAKQHQGVGYLRPEPLSADIRV